MYFTSTHLRAPESALQYPQIPLISLSQCYLLLPCPPQATKFQVISYFLLTVVWPTCLQNQTKKKKKAKHRGWFGIKEVLLSQFPGVISLFCVLSKAFILSIQQRLRMFEIYKDDQK